MVLQKHLTLTSMETLQNVFIEIENLIDFFIATIIHFV